MTAPQSSSQPPFSDASVQSQIDELWRRGMAIPHRGEASRFLTHVGSYRLRGYWQPFEDRSQDGDPPPFRTGTNFAAVMYRYNFDRELRALLLDAFGHIEVSIRNGWALHLGENAEGGPYAHLNSRLFLDRYYANLSELHRAYDRHGKRAHRYDFADCPIWAIAEAMSFGQLSRWYGDTNRAARQLMARRYGMDERILQAVLRHLVPIRNICAHHERLWDREFITRMPVPNRLGEYPRPRRFFNQVDNGRLYNALVMVAYLIRVIEGNGQWAAHLLALMDGYPRIPQERMGFLSNWKRFDIWQS
jgi:abortive infection bacteriophage resistance protein